jgi:hypothetical protein
MGVITFFMEDKNTQYFNLFYSRIYIYPKVQSLKSIFLTDSTHIHANFLQKFSCICPCFILKIDSLPLDEIFTNSPSWGERSWKTFWFFNQEKKRIQLKLNN